MIRIKEMQMPKSPQDLLNLAVPHALGNPKDKNSWDSKSLPPFILKQLCII